MMNSPFPAAGGVPTVGCRAEAGAGVGADAGAGAPELGDASRTIAGPLKKGTISYR